MKAHTGIALTAEEVPHAYTALLHFEDSMDKYKHWLTDKQSKPLPGMETAIEQIDGDMKEIRTLIMRIYETSYMAKPATPT